MKELKINSKGSVFFTKVDDDIYEKFKDTTLCLHNGGYVITLKDGYLHRIVMNAKKGDNMVDYCGVFKDELEAAKAYDKKAIELYGEFANLNIPL